MFKKFAAAAIAFSVAGCASAPPVIPFDAATAAAYQGRTVTPVIEATPDFMPFRASHAAFGMVGSLAMISEGRTYADENSIRDPSRLIETRLAQRLSSLYQLPVGAALDVSSQPGQAYPTNASALYVDAKTSNWGYMYFSFDWSRFQVNYWAVIQLIDASNSTVVGQYVCQKVSHDDPASAPTLEELLANDSALMNQLLETMATQCAGEFETQVLGVTA